jgi:RNA polymerase sigma factor (TIGR02999 family)
MSERTGPKITRGGAPHLSRTAAAGELFPMIYGELRRVARRYLGRERKNHTLQPTALVHEAWMRLQNDRAVQWHGRTQGLALAAQAMRRLLVDHGRHQKRDKRGGGVAPVTLDDLLKAAATAAVPVEDLLTLETALTRLEVVDPRGAQVVILRFFSGMSSPEVAEHLQVSVRTVESDWTHAKAWLRRELAGKSAEICDGLGAPRVAEAFLGLIAARN